MAQDTDDALAEYVGKLRAIGRNPGAILERAYLSEVAVQEWIARQGRLDLELIVRMVPAFWFSPTMETELHNLRERSKDLNDKDSTKLLARLGAIIGVPPPDLMLEMLEKGRAAYLLDFVHHTAATYGHGPDLEAAYNDVAGEVPDDFPQRWKGLTGQALRKKIDRALAAPWSRYLGQVGLKSPRPKRKPGPKKGRFR